MPATAPAHAAPAPATLTLADPAERPEGDQRSRAGWSFYGRWRRCPREWAYDQPEYQDQGEPQVFGIGNPAAGSFWAQSKQAPDDIVAALKEEADARALGTLVHALLEDYYAKQMGEIRPAPHVRAQALSQALRIPQGDRKLALDRFTAYVVFWGAEPEYEVLAVEKEYGIGFLPKDGVVQLVPLGTPGSVPFTARIDLVRRHRKTGVIVWDDHKTASEINKGDTWGYGMSGQIHGHWVLGRYHHGNAFQGPRLNYIQTRTGPKFVRASPPAAPDMVMRHPRTVVATAWEIAQWRRYATEAKDFPPAADATICRHRWGLCDHITRCRFSD